MPQTPRARRKKETQGAQAARALRPDRRRVWSFAALGIILVVSLLRSMHLGFPLERDEGEFGYIAQELLRGVPVYVSAYTQKLPGSYFIYALFFLLFGQSTTAIHVGLLLVNAAIMALIFLTLRKTHNGPAGCIGALAFGVMAMSPTVVGFAGHATFFVSLFAVGGLYALIHAREQDRAALFLVSGLCFGLAFLMKQSAIFFAPLAGVLLVADYLSGKPRRLARLARQGVALLAGALAPMVVTAAYYAAIGKLHLLWFWAFQLAGEFAGQVGLAYGVRNAVEHTLSATAGFEVLWALAVAGLVVTLLDRARRADRLLYATFAGAGVLSVVPGYYFTSHYYIAALPGAALLIGALGGVVAPDRPLSGRSLWPAAGVWALTAIGLVVGLARHGDYYFGLVSDAEESRRIYRGNPFVESIEIGNYVKSHTKPEDRIAVLGSETQIYFYSQRRSASRFVNTYFLTAEQPRALQMQHEMIHDIEQARPAYLLLVVVPTSWSFQPKSSHEILDWFDKYHPGRYELEGLLLYTPNGRVFKWGAEARAEPLTPGLFYVAILRRLEPGGPAALRGGAPAIRAEP